jgi:hypothetical protein
MTGNGAKPFENNWAYLKTELRWLDRVLMMAVSRKRQDDKTLHRVAHTSADKVTSHWWKGIIAINRGIDDREGPPPKPVTQPAPAPLSYSQQLEARIQASYQAEVVLALPLLRDRLALSEVEKNILLMAIAPEINRRYGRLYDYLQEEEGALADLPTVDLCLRLLCRNDNDWQQARSRLTGTNSLVHRGLIEWVGDEEGTLLSQQVRVSNDLANYLLSNMPDPLTLDGILSGTVVAPDTLSTLPEAAVDPVTEASLRVTPETDTDEEPATTLSPTTAPRPTEDSLWEPLVLPKTLLRQLQYLSRQAEQRHQHPELPGLMVLLVGHPGTGKTLAAATLAAAMGLPLTYVDLEAVSPENYPASLTASPSDEASLLLVKQGQQWFGRQPQVESTWVHQWLQWRSQFGLTVVSVPTLELIRPRWRQKFDCILTFPRPDTPARRRLWQQAFEPAYNIEKLDWPAIARHLPLTGGEIQAIAQTVQLDLQARGRKTVTLQALREALQLHHPQLDLPSTKRS